MAHFIGYVQGNRGEASRLGSKMSGLRVEANGWGFGVKVKLGVDLLTGEDYAYIYLTTGSNGYGEDTLLGKYTREHMKGGILCKKD